eukprot:gene3536-3873_t
MLTSLITVLLLLSVFKDGIASCPCGNEAVFNSQCHAVDKWAAAIKAHLTSLACYCLCPREDVKSLQLFRNLQKWDKYHIDQQQFLRDVSHHPNFTAHGGVVYVAVGGDHRQLPKEVRKHMVSIGQPWLAHSFLKESESSPPTDVILIPDPAFLRTRGFQSQIHDMETMSRPFAQREKKCFWRGSLVGTDDGEVLRERYGMCQLAKNFSWVDAAGTFGKTTHTLSDDTREKDNLLPSNDVREVNWTDYRCLLDVDGSANAWGLYWRLASGSVVMKVQSNWTNAYIEAMEPWKHYIPIDPSFSSFERVTSLIARDDVADVLHAITERAKALTKQFSYENEVDRIATELSSFYENYRWENLTRSSSAGMNGNQDNNNDLLGWIHHRVDILLGRFNPQHHLHHPAKSHNGGLFNHVMHYDEDDYHSEFPDLVKKAFSESPTSCFSQAAKSKKECTVLNSIPALPALSSPLNTTTLQWSDELKAYYGPGNTATYLKLRDSYHQSKHCPGSNRHQQQQFSNNSSSDRIGAGCSKIDHLIFTEIDQNINCNKVSLFFRSLRESGVCAHVVAYHGHQHTVPPCGDIIHSCGSIEFLSMENSQYALHNIPPALRKIILFLEYMNHLLLAHPEQIVCKQVLLTNFDNVYFQRNPFASFLNHLDAEVVFTEESYSEKNIQSTIAMASDLSWLKGCTEEVLGRNILSQISAMPVINSGLVLGSFGGMFKMLWTLVYTIELFAGTAVMKNSATAMTNDVNLQGLVNFVYYTGMLESVMQKVRVLPPSASLFIHGVSRRPTTQEPKLPYDFQTNPMVNDLGMPYAVVHMYYYFHMMLICEEWILAYGGIDWKFNTVAPPRTCNMSAFPSSSISSRHHTIRRRRF